MSVKPLSGQTPNIFTTTTLSSASLFVKTTTASGAASKAATSAGPVDAVTFSAKALASLKGQAASAASPAGTETAPAAAKTTAPEAGWTGPSIQFKRPSLTLEGDQPAFAPGANQAIMDYQRDKMAHRFGMMSSVREALGLSANIDDGGGVALTGKIADVIDKTLALDGKGGPQKPPELLAREAAQQGTSGMPEGTAKTSMITLYLPGTQGTGSEQIEIMIDDSAMEKLAAMSPQAVKDGLVDMLGGGDEAKAGNAAMKSGAFGKFMEENKDWHPEFASSKARFGLFDPDKGNTAQPMLMIQSESRPDYVRDHVGQLVDGVMKLLRGAAPPAATAATSEAPAAAPAAVKG